MKLQALSGVLAIGLLNAAIAQEVTFKSAPADNVCSTDRIDIRIRGGSVDPNVEPELEFLRQDVALGMIYFDAYFPSTASRTKKTDKVFSHLKERHAGLVCFTKAEFDNKPTSEITPSIENLDGSVTIRLGQCQYVTLMPDTRFVAKLSGNLAPEFPGITVSGCYRLL